MKNYRHIFFDLDRTIWDFDNNSLEVLKDLFNKYKLSSHFRSDRDFVDTYHRHNEILWAEYREGKLSKEILRSKRFALCFEEVKHENPNLATEIGEDYLTQCSLKTRLFPNAHEILGYLRQKYSLYILTNGFHETQWKKLRNCRLEEYFTKVFTSETIGYNKPNVKIFHWAVSSVNARKEESLMIGDDPEVDIAGAKRYGIDTVFFNPSGIESTIKADFEIKDLIELREVL